MLLRLYNKNNNPKDLEEVIRVLEEGGLIISGRTKISPRVICFFSWMPSSEVQRLNAT
jgi:hypothetical protein